MTNGRVAPHSIEAEESLISCTLIDPQGSMGASMEAGIKPLSFYDPRNRVIYEQLVGLFADGQSPDTTMLVEQLKKSGRLDEAGGVAHVIKLSGRATTTAQLSYFIERVYDLSQRRAIIHTATDAVEKCYDESGSVAEQLSKPVNDLLTLVAGSEVHSEPDWCEVVDESAKIAESIIEHKGKPAHMMIKWPWPELDERFSPMERGQLVVIGARPSIGKSSLLRPIALSCAEQGHPVFYITLEVNPTQVPLQLAAMKSRVGIRQLSRAHLKDQGDFMKALKDMRALGIIISRRDRSLSRIVGRARALNSKKKLGMVCIDYLGLLDDIAQSSAKEMVVVIGMVTKMLKRLAVEENLVVVVAAQLNRLSAYDGNREPKLSDLKASGDIESDADTCVLIHRPNENPETNQPQPETTDVKDLPRFYQTLLLAKGRDSGTSRAEVSFDRATVSFTPIRKINP